MEAGWFGKDKNYVKKEVIVKNNHYLEEKEKISNEITVLREKYTNLLRERDGLLAKLKEYENLIAQLRSQTNVV